MRVALFIILQLLQNKQAVCVGKNHEKKLLEEIMKKAFLLFVILLLSLFGCSKKNPSKLTIGIIKPSLNHLPLEFGFDIGVLEKEDYVIKHFNSGWETNEALVAEKIDVAILPFTYIWNDVAKGKKVKVLSFLERESDGIITKKEYTKLSDLKGKKIGVLRASTLDVFAEMISEKYALNFELVYFRTPMDMATALKSGEVDALSYYVPSIFKFTDKFHIVYWYGEDFPSHTCCNIAATEVALETKLDNINNFLSGMQKSAEAINKSFSKTKNAAERFYELQPKYAEQSLLHTKYIMGLDEDGKNFEISAIKKMLELGYLDRSVKSEDVYFEKQ